MKECSKLSTNLNLNEDTKGFNNVILIEEVESAIELTKTGKSPGPNAFYADFFSSMVVII